MIRASSNADLQEMGRRIADRREELGLTQKELADRADLSVTFLSEVENGKRNISSVKLLRVADALDTTMDFIARGNNQEARHRTPIRFPPELSEAAEEEGWSYSQARGLLQTRELILERRSPHGGEASKAPYTKYDWKELYRRLFECE
jgi:transcriptional regulator with XRE-family HTH domain